MPPHLRIQHDGAESVVLLMLDDGVEVPLGVGRNVVEAILDARALLAIALANVDGVLQDVQDARDHFHARSESQHGG